MNGRQMLADLFELPISTGSLQNFLETAAENVKPAHKPLKKPSKRPKSVMLMRQALYQWKRAWLHTVSTPELTYYEPHQSRGKKATDAIGILPEFTGALFTITGRPISSINCCFMPCAMPIICAS
ncbi:MAG: transposase [Chloroflexi bacterium]|nr:transposase [Chloroflexota bacterium]